MSFPKNIIPGGKFTVYNEFNFYIVNFFARNAGLYLNSPGIKDILPLLWTGVSEKPFKMS